MIFVMLSPLFIIGFIALSIYEEKRRKKNEAAKKHQMILKLIQINHNIKINLCNATKGVSQ